jgi:DNA invertase Pin-like site-specific DNA recombinase
VTPRSTRKLRCAVYTRKSSEEGLELEFNSLHAQREAALAYIASQKSEGWLALPDHYDDGGISGGTLERPALKRLLRDIEAGLIDVVVVYKIDRLSRSLMDFAKLVDVFERHNVTFVSVTQQFNTTTSMGRLTLNVLLSFAQFEREVIGERIRDKFAASRAKGIWMGGWPPLGYEVQDRGLVVVEREAAIVRRIFDRFTKTGSALTVARELNAAGEVTKQRCCASGSRGGRPWTKGAVYKVLANRVYLGKAVHKRVAYPGEHAAIIDQRAWEGARGHGRAGPPSRRRHPRAGACAAEGPDLRPERPGDVAEPHPPTRAHLQVLRDPRGDRGRLRDLRDHQRAGRRRRGRSPQPRPEAAGRTGAGRAHLGDGEAGGRGRDHRARGHGAARRVRRGLGRAVPRRAGAHRPAAGRTGRRARGRAGGPDKGRGAGEPRGGASAAGREEGGMTGRVETRLDGMTLVVRIPMRFQRRGGRKRIVAPGMLEEGRFASIRELAEAERVGVSYVARILRLTLLAPDVVERILGGRGDLQLAELMQPFPVEWQRQRERFG